MANYGGAASGALAGAASGAAVGSIIPGVGTAVGAVGGGLVGLLGGLFSGKKDAMKQIERLGPEAKEAILNTLKQVEQMQGPGGNYNQAQNYQSNLLSGSPEAFNRFAAPHRTEFEEQTIPRLSERFAGLGGPLGGPGLSSGFGQAIGGASTQFQSNLAGLYAQLQNQAAQQATGQYNTLLGYGLTPTFQSAYQQGQPGFGPTALAGFAQGAGTAFGQSYGNSLSNKFSDLFKSGGTAAPTGAPTGGLP